MPEDFQNESHLNFLWMQLFVVGIKRCYMNLLVNSIIKLIQMLVFIWRLQFFFFFSQRRNTYCLLLLFRLSEFVWGSGLWLPFATCLCNSSSKCTFSVQFLQSYCVLESIASNLFSTVQFIYVSKRLLLIPDFVFWWLIGVTFHKLSGHCAPVEEFLETPAGMQCVCWITLKQCTLPKNLKNVTYVIMRGIWLEESI